MEVGLKELAASLEQIVIRMNGERENDGLPPLKVVQISILGQFALMAHPIASKVFQLAMTKDVDALISADWSVRSVFKQLIGEKGFVYDELSSEIWIPPNATYEVLYESPLLTIKVLSPLFVLMSKAIKAPEKNRFLIQQALAHYGKELADLIEKHRGDLKFFE